MTNQPFIVDRTTADLAAEMIAIFGDDAASQAAERANRSRNAGNAVRFCRWRMAEKLIGHLTTDRAGQTVH